MLLFELIQVALGQRDRLSHIPNKEEWGNLYAEIIKQSVAGVAFEGVQKLPKDQWPPQALLFEWIGLCEQIKNQNLVANRRSAEVTKLFSDAGFCSCILKGQGNAMMYPNPFVRMSGDIDIWVCPKSIMDEPTEKTIRATVNEFVKTQYPDTDEQDEHIEYPVFSDIPVEVHYKPGNLVRPKHNKRFVEYYNAQVKSQMNHAVELPQDMGKINVPTIEFNIIFQMMHMMNHFLVEGIGLRHFVDYYYVLQNNHLHNTDTTGIQNKFKEFGLLRFAKGVMWIEKECLGLGNEYLILEPDEKRGRVILKEMLEGGNFGHHDERYKSRKNGFIARGIADGYRLLKLMTVFPSESMWKLYRKVENQRWKLK